jgi:hypothetical protein
MGSNFELGKLEGFDPKKINWRTRDPEQRKLDGFFLTLGLIYNDVKGLHWWLAQLKSNFMPINTREPSAALGEYSGMSFQVTRLLFGLLFELVQTLRENNKVLGSQRSVQVVNQLPDYAKEAWLDLIRLSRGEIPSLPEANALRAFMQRVRSTGAFHYYNVKSMVDGYGKTFGTNSALTKKAFYSVGNRMEVTRFYFSDAAVQGARNTAFDEFSELHGISLNVTGFEEVFIPRANHALRFLVARYFDLEQIRR